MRELVFLTVVTLYNLSKELDEPVAFRIDNISGVAVDDFGQHAERKR